MATVGRLKILLEADGRKMRRAFRAISRSVFSLKTAMLGTLGVGGFGALVKQSLASADAIAKQADKVGVSVAALQELRFAAKSAGVEARIFNMGLQRFSRRIAEAAKGKGELRDTLKEYGIALTDTAGRTRTVEAVLGDYANAIKNAATPQEQLRLAFKAFDSEAAAMVNLLREGNQGLKIGRARAREMGAVIRTDLVRGAEQMNTRWDEFTYSMRVRFRSAILENQGALKELIRLAIEGASRVTQFLSDRQKNIKATKNLEDARRIVKSIDIRTHGQGVTPGNVELFKAQRRAFDVITRSIKGLEERGGKGLYPMSERERAYAIGYRPQQNAEPVKEQKKTNSKLDRVVFELRRGNQRLALPE